MVTASAHTGCVAVARGGGVLAVDTEGTVSLLATGGGAVGIGGPDGYGGLGGEIGAGLSLFPLAAVAAASGSIEGGENGDDRSQGTLGWTVGPRVRVQASVGEETVVLFGGGVAGSLLQLRSYEMISESDHGATEYDLTSLGTQVQGYVLMNVGEPNGGFHGIQLLVGPIYQDYHADTIF